MAELRVLRAQNAKLEERVHQLQLENETLKRLRQFDAVQYEDFKKLKQAKRRVELKNEEYLIRLRRIEELAEVGIMM